MFRMGIGTLLLTAVFAAGCAGGLSVGKLEIPERAPVGWTVPLERLGINGSVARLAEPHDWAVRQVSSYDRRGKNNDDRYAEQVYDGGVILADLKGPGCVTRIWTRNPWGTLFIYIDDIEHPIITTPFEDLFSGNLELFSPGFNLFSPPFVGEGTGGYYCNVPIPYKERCRLIVTGGDEALAYQVTYVEFPQGTPISSFELALDTGDVSYFRRWRDSWKDTSMRFWDRKSEKFHHSKTILWPGEDYFVFPIEGPAVITELEMAIDSFEPDMIGKAWLVIYFDGQEEPGVVAPIGDFFGNGHAEGIDHDGLVMGNDEGRMWLRYPMPFKTRANIRIVNLTDEMADFDYSLTWRPGPIDDQLYFFARYNSGVSVEGQPYSVANIKGEGHFAGCTISATQADSLTFLEGDDAYIVDGQPAGNFHGTGTDDYFNGGWYFATGPHSAHTHATTHKVARAPAAFSAYRNHVLEPVPFASSFSFPLEHGPFNDRPGVQYASVAYWYQIEKEPETWPIAELEGVRLFR